VAEEQRDESQGKQRETEPDRPVLAADPGREQDQRRAQGEQIAKKPHDQQVVVKEQPYRGRPQADAAVQQSVTISTGSSAIRGKVAASSARFGMAPQTTR
jgi:Flp pilus assembly protein TadD